MSAPASVFAFVRLSLLLCLTLVWPLAATAAERAIELLPGIDYFGRDYSTLKSVTLDDCQAACLNDSRCRAFTYNTKAEWCFLKENHEEARPFAGAISGQVVERTEQVAGADEIVPRPVSPAVRLADLGFLPPRELGEARRLAAKLASAPAPNAKLATLTAQARTALQSNQPAQAVALQSQALRLAPDDRGLWASLAESSSDAAQSGDWSERQRHRQQSTAAAINAYARTQDDAERAATLALIARTLAQREEWRAAIRANRAALALEIGRAHV